MIRVFLFSEEIAPPALTDFLKKSDGMLLENEAAASDVLLIYTPLWNRAALARIRHILERGPNAAVVVCEHAEEPFASGSVMRNEVSGVLTSDATGQQILAALRAALTGLKVLQRHNNRRLPSETIPLTPREIEVLSLIADGEGNKSIADLLEISEHTVKFHISSILEKLQVSSRTEAVKAGILRGLISI